MKYGCYCVALETIIPFLQSVDSDLTWLDQISLV